MTSQAVATDPKPGRALYRESVLHELRGGTHPVAQLTGGLCHVLIVYDELANVAAEAFRCCEMNCIQRSEFLWLQHSCSGENVVAHADEIASSEDGTAGSRRLFTARQQGAEHLGSCEGARNPGTSAAQIPAKRA